MSSNYDGDDGGWQTVRSNKDRRKSHNSSAPGSARTPARTGSWARGNPAPPRQPTSTGRRQKMSEQERLARAEREAREDAKQQRYNAWQTKQRSNIYSNKKQIRHIMMGFIKGTIKIDDAVKGLLSMCEKKTDLEKSKILEEVVRYKCPEVLEHPQISDLIVNTRTRDGHSYMHWVMYGVKGLTRTLDDMIRTIHALHMCGCSPFKLNGYNETCIDAAHAACNDGFLQKEYLPHVIAALMTPPNPKLRRDELIMRMNMITDPNTVHGAVIWWCVADQTAIKFLAEECVRRSLQVSSDQRSKGTYPSIKQALDILTDLFSKPPPKCTDTDAFFEFTKVDPKNTLRVFKESVIECAMKCDTDETDESRCALGAVGAVVGICGTPDVIIGFVTHSIKGGRLMNAITCIGHSGVFTKAIADAIIESGDMKRCDKFQLECVLEQFFDHRVTFNNIARFTYAGNRPVAIGGVPRRQSAPAINRVAPIIAQQNVDDFTPPFDCDAKPFRVVIGLESLDPETFVASPNGTITPEKVDDKVYSLQMDLTEQMRLTDSGERVMATLMREIVDGANDENTRKSVKFILDNCSSITRTKIEGAIKALMGIPASEMSNYFDSRHASENIRWFAKEYNVSANSTQAKGGASRGGGRRKK